MEKAYQGIKFLKACLKRLNGGFLPLLAFLAFWPGKADAIIIISDEETERFLADTARPFFDSAGIPFKRNKLYIVQDNSLNAFVGDGNNLFIHTGTITSSDNRNELEGVIAHEIGHIEGGHILRGKIQAQSLQQIGLASAVLAGAAAVIGGRGDMAMAMAVGGQGATLNQFLNYRTSEERSADEAAVKLLKANNKSPEGMLEFMKKIEQRNILSGREETPYFRTHPMTKERISFLEKAVKEAGRYATPEKDEEFDRVKAKLTGFLENPAQTLRKYPLSDKSTSALYARTIAYFKQMKLQQALRSADELIAREPDNPYFHELKGQIYIENGKVRQAETEYEKALELLPNSALFKVNWAQAALENSPERNKLQKIVNLLNQAALQRPGSFVYMLLSRAYEGLGQRAYAEYAAAEFSLSIGELKTARRQAENALKQASNNRQLRLKLNDLLTRIDDYEKNQ